MSQMSQMSQMGTATVSNSSGKDGETESKGSEEADREIYISKNQKKSIKTYKQTKSYINFYGV